MKRAALIALSASMMIAQAARAQDTSSEYNGTSFREMVEVISDRSVVTRNDDERNELAVYRSGKLPQYPITMASIFAAGTARAERDAKRTTTDKHDYYDHLSKIVHSNGVCVSGTWQIDANSPYSGLFAKNAKALVVARISAATGSTKRGEKRGFGFAAKLFPTINPDEQVKTVNFFSVDVLMGTTAPHYLDVATTNEPDTGFDIWGIRLGLKIANAFKTADINPGFRPITPLAKVGTDAAQVKAPKWIRISADAKTVKNEEVDFRDEVVRAMKENGKLVFNVDVSNESGDRNAKTGWARVGKIVVDQAAVTYGCDRRLHFAHPKAND